MLKEKNSFKNYDDGRRFWIYRIDLDNIYQFNNLKCLGFKSKKSKEINNISKDDMVILITKRKNLEFFALTSIDNVFIDKEEYCGFNAPKKLKLKGIKYFSNPIKVTDLKNDLKFIKNKNAPHDSLRSEYKEIMKDDFFNILKTASFTKEFPTYFEDIDMPLKDFILNTIKALFKIIKYYETRTQIEIKKFLFILKKTLDEYDIHKTVEELEIFYSLYIHELGFKHIPSRDPDNFVTLQTISGDKVNFGYISLE